MRHVFLQTAAEAELHEKDWRAEADEPEVGVVKEASYLAKHDRGPRRGLGGWLSQLFFDPGADQARFRFPFTPAGDDALGLLAEAAPPLDGHADPAGEIRAARGKIVCLEPRVSGDEVVLVDFWLNQPPVGRIVVSLDFALSPIRGCPIVVCCAMAPLVIATPREETVGALLARLEPRSTQLAEEYLAGRTREAGQLLELREGEEVEVIGVVCDAPRRHGRFDLQGRSSPYRDAAPVEPLFIGDQPGVRLVLRRIERGAATAEAGSRTES